MEVWCCGYGKEENSVHPEPVIAVVQLRSDDRSNDDTNIAFGNFLAAVLFVVP